MASDIEHFYIFHFGVYFRERFYLENDYIRLNDSYRTSNPEISFNPANLTGSFDALLTPETEQFEAQILSTIAQHVALRTTYDNLLFYSVLHRYLQDAFAVSRFLICM